MRALRLVSLVVLVLFTTLTALPAAAAGNYSQNFSTTPANWSSVNDTFAVVNGAYASQATANYPQRAIAFYNGNTWGTNFTYSAKLNSDYESDGNRVGIVFNYVDSQNFYDMSVSMRKTATSDPTSGHATISRWVGGTQTVIADFHPADTAPWPTRDTFFTVTVTRVGVNTVLKVDGATVFNTNAFTDTSAGRIGFFAQFNNGRFDDVAVVDNSALTYMFRSGFNGSVATTTPTCILGNPTSTWFLSLTGSDSTGFAWPPSYWGGPAQPPYMFNTIAPCTSSDPPTAMDAYVKIGIKDATGPTGTTSRVLSNTVVQWHPNGNLSIEPRAGVTYQLASGATPGTSYYMRRYLKYPSDLLTRTGDNYWFAQHEYKTVCAPTSAHSGRLGINWEKNGGVPTYHLNRDFNNNCSQTDNESWVKTCKASGASGECPVMPVGQWFYDEVYMSFPTSGMGGIVKYAINGQVIFDYTSTSTEHLPTIPNRVKMTPGYMNGTNFEIQVDDLEMLESPPCATFPCGPPTHVAD